MCFLSPFVILFAVFGVFPLAFSLYLAFQTWEPTSGLGAMEFVGLDNYAFALQDEWFWKSLKNTAWLALASGVPQHLVAIPLAYFIHARSSGCATAWSAPTSCPTSPRRWRSRSCSARCSRPTTA